MPDFRFVLPTIGDASMMDCRKLVKVKNISISKEYYLSMINGNGIRNA